ncbi:MAG: hypothetical protein ACLFVW_03705 [Phycisphaerae bacterium]
MSATRRIPVTIAAMVAVLAAAVPVGGETPNVVYYQVTRQDGTVEDVSRVPQSDEGIRRVLRIARYEGPDRGYEVLSTDSPPAMIDRGRTERHELIWRDGAWVAPADVERKRREELERSAQQPATRPADAEEAGRLELQLRILLEHMEQLDQRLTEAEDELLEARGGEGAQAARERLRELMTERIRLEEIIERLERRLAEARGDLAELPDPRGDVQPYSSEEYDAPDIGIIEPLEETAAAPHRVQAWKLPEQQGRRRIRVAAAHPEAGAFGAVVYVAYADTDGDGRADEVLSRSPVAQADRPGRWTSWSFLTEQPRVFVGCAPLGEDNTIYFRPTRPDGDNWAGAEDVYVSEGIELVPRRGGDGFLSNVRIHVIHETNGDD